MTVPETRAGDPPRGARTALTLLVAGYLLLLASGLITITGGAAAAIGPVRLSATRPAMPALAGTLCLLAAVACRRLRLASDLAQLWSPLTRRAGHIAAAVAVAVFATGVAWGTFAASASDASGYVSQATLLAHGGLELSEPLIHTAAWPDAAATLSPLGYRPGRRTGVLVPTYPPGFPLTMAPFIRAGGEQAAYLVVPMLGALCVFAAWTLGSTWFDPVTGLVAAVWLATSPILLFQVTQPMSDVPATAWFTFALVGASSGRPRATALGGLATGLAWLTRPNLLPPLAGLIAVVILVAPRRARWRQLALFGAAALPGVMALLWWQYRVYGSPFTSGYGSFDDLFDRANVLTNIRLYASWMTQSETALVWLAIVAPWVIGRDDANGPGRRLLTLVGLLLVALVAVPFLAYAVFDNWTYARFLLPALPLLLVLSSGVLTRVVRVIPPAAALAVVAMFIATMTMRNIAWAQQAGAFQVSASDHRFVAVGRFVAGRLPPDAIVIAGEHSGSVRFYAGRSILRWDLMPAAAFRTAVDQLQAAHPLVLVLDDWEELPFSARHAPETPVATLDWPPIAQANGNPAARVYLASDRARYRNGATWETQPLP